jgi:hypothetical protein
MTTLATVLGLIPLALGMGGERSQSPLAIAVIGGLTVSTFLTLLFVPTLCTVFEERFGKKINTLMKKIQLNNIFILVAASLIYAGALYVQKDTLTIERCIDIALKSNPQVKIAESNYDLSASNLTSTRSTLFPQVAFNTGWTRNGGSFFQGPTSREATYEN